MIAPSDDDERHAAGAVQNAMGKLERLVGKHGDVRGRKAVCLEIKECADGCFPVEKIASKEHVRQTSGSWCGSNSQTETIGNSFENSMYSTPIPAKVAAVMEISTQVGA